MSQPLAENKMGVMPVNKLLISMSVPIMISMLVQAMYNVVDSVFVSHYSSNGLAALSFAFPVQNMLIAVGVGTAIGVNSLLSRRLGERRFEEANAVAENGLLLAVCSWLVFAIFGLFCSRWFFTLFTNNAETIEMGTQYLSICTVLSIGCFVQITTERILQATGRTMFTMITQSTGAIINIILDPILIFGLFGMPEMGVAGAAIATVGGQLIAMVLALFLNAKYNHEIKISIRTFRPCARTIKEIYQVGIPSIVVQSITSVMVVGLNTILAKFTETAVSVLGVYFKLQSFVFMPVFGLTNGMVPIVAYNFGAGRKERIFQAIKLTGIYAMCIMLLGTTIFCVFPEQLMRMFDASQEMLEIGVPALQIISLSFCGAAIGITLSSVFQAIGSGLFSLLMSFFRQIGIILPLAYVVSLYFPLGVVWASIPIAEVLALCLSVTLFVRTMRTKLHGLVPIEQRMKAEKSALPEKPVENPGT